MDDFVVAVRQVYQYPLQTTAGPGDVVLLQQSGPGNLLAGPYGSMNILDIITQARRTGGSIGLASTDIIAWSPGPSISFDGTSLNITGTPVAVNQLNAQSVNSVGDVFANGIALANQDWVTALFDSIVESSVWTVNGRKGNVVLGEQDIKQAGGAPLNSPRFSGIVIAPTPWNLHECNDRVATTEWVQRVVHCAIWGLDTNDINRIFLNSAPGVFPRSINPPLGDASTRIATTSFVDESLTQLQDVIDHFVSQQYAPINSPQFTGVPSAPTAAPGSNTSQLATTSFVQTAIVASTTGVSHFNGRTGSVTLLESDITGAGGAPIDSPDFTGTALAVTPPTGTNTNQIATCAFVLSEIGSTTAGVSTFNGRSGAVSLLATDISGVGGALLASPIFTGAPQAPTAAQNTNTTQLATCAFVQAALSAAPGGVSSFNGRTGAITLQANDLSAVGGALLNSPAFTGTPTAPVPPNADNSAAIATTSWVLARLTGAGNVTTWNGRAGNVTMTALDIQNAAGALYRQSDTPPTQPQQTFWYNSLNGQLYLQYVDPVTSALSWVVANSQVQPAPAAGTRVLLMSNIVTTTPVATVNFIYTFTNQYDLYELECYNVQLSAAGNSVGIQASYDGSTWDAGANYSESQSGWNVLNQSIGSGGTGFGYGMILPGLTGGVANPAYTSSVRCTLMMPWTTDRNKVVSFIGAGVTSGAAYNHNGMFLLATNNAWMGFRLLLTGGLISRGVFNLYGIVKAGAGAN